MAKQPTVSCPVTIAAFVAGASTFGPFLGPWLGLCGRCALGALCGRLEAGAADDCAESPCTLAAALEMTMAVAVKDVLGSRAL